MAILAAAEGPILDEILEATYDIWSDGLSRRAYAQFWTAQRRTAWGRRSLERFALLAGSELSIVGSGIHNGDMGSEVATRGLGSEVPIGALGSEVERPEVGSEVDGSRVGPEVFRPDAESEVIARSAASEVQASAKLYTFQATLDGRPITVAGLGAIFTQPAHRGRGAARELIERLLALAANRGADLALLFSEIGPDYYARLGFTPIATTTSTIRVVEDDRRGAPATMVRAGEDRDLADIVAINAVGAAPYRFHLNRDRDLVHYGLAKKRLLAGLGQPGAREVQFFIAEEGASAAAYVVLGVKAGVWTVEECGDRDPAGARVGAILQVLVARDPTERRPRIRAWLPDGFLPPQIRVVDREPARDVMMVRALTPAGAPAHTLRERDIVYWRADLF